MPCQLESQPKKRILFIGETLGIGGAERSVVNILPALIKRGYACEVACLRPPYSFADEIEKMGVPVHRMHLSHFWNVPEGVFKVSRLLRRGRYDFIFSLVFFASNYVALSKLFVRSGLRIVSLQALEFERDNFRNPWMFLRKWFRIALMRQCMDGIVAASRPITEHYAQYFKREDIAVVPNSVSSSAFNFKSPLSRTQIRKLYGVTERDFVIITPARFIEEKGHIYIIQALKTMLSKGLKIKALFFGYGELEKELYSQVQKAALEDSILFHKPLSQPDLFAAITASDLFVLPSTSEGFGLAIAEASALGAPVIATKIGGILDVVEDGVSALLIPSRDSQKLAEAMERLMSDAPFRQRLSQAAKERSTLKFNHEAVGEQMDRYLTNLQNRFSLESTQNLVREF